MSGESYNDKTLWIKLIDFLGKKSKSSAAKSVDSKQS